MAIPSCNNIHVARTVYDEPKTSKSKVILLAGGENCLGYSYSYHLQELDGVSKQKFKEYQTGYDNVKISYRNMLSSTLVHKEQSSFVKTRLGQGKAANEGIEYGCLGPEVGIAEYLSNFRHSENYYIIKFAGGGESGFKYQWNSDAGVYYKKMTTFFDEQLQKLKANNIDFEVSSFMFVQGETDAKNDEPNYGDYLDNFVNDVKVRYHDYAQQSGMSFIDAGVSTHYMLNYRSINDAKKEVMSNDKNNFFIDTIVGDISRNKDNMDRIHYDAMGEIKLGHLFARAYLALESQESKDLIYEFSSKERIESLDNTYSQELVNEGNYSKYHYLFNESKITIDVLDDKPLWNDGVSIKYLTSASEEQLDVFNQKMVNLYVDNSIEYFEYDFANGKLVEKSSHPDFESATTGLVNNEGKQAGYRLELTIPNSNNKKVFVSLGAIQNGSQKYSRQLSCNDNNIKSYPYISNNKLIQNKYVANGEFFGSTPNLKATKGWNLFEDKGDSPQITITDGLPLNTVFAYRNSNNVLTFNAYIGAESVINFDLYPKFGIILVNEEFTGIFYYVDAYGSGYTLEGTDLGYCQVTNGAFSNYVSLEHKVGYDPNVYLNGNTIKLGLRRNEDQYSFLFNDLVISTVQNVTNIGLADAYFGINTYNTKVVVKNYKFSS